MKSDLSRLERSYNMLSEEYYILADRHSRIEPNYKSGEYLSLMRVTTHR